MCSLPRRAFMGMSVKSQLILQAHLLRFHSLGIVLIQGRDMLQLLPYWRFSTPFWNAIPSLISRNKGWYRNTCSQLEKLFMYFHLPSWQTTLFSLLPVFLPLAVSFYPVGTYGMHSRSCFSYHFTLYFPSLFTNCKKLWPHNAIPWLNSVLEE